MAAERDAPRNQRLKSLWLFAGPARNSAGAKRAAHVAFAAAPFALDVWMRGPRFYVAEPRALVDGAASVLVWYLAASLGARRWARAVVAFAVASLLVLELLCFRYYHVPLDAQALESAQQAWGDVKPVAFGLLPGALLLTAAVGATGYAALAFALSRPGPLKRLPAAIALGACVAVAAPAAQAPIGIRLVPALELFWPAHRAARHTAARLSPLRSRRTTLPGVLFILDESVRASDYCSAYDAACATSPEVNALLADRVGLTQMHAVDSYTALSISALLTGQPQTEPRETIVARPDLLQIARAVRAGSQRLTVAYWSAQKKTAFENAATLEAADSVIDVETLVGRHVDDEEAVYDLDLDRRLVDVAARKLRAGVARPLFLFLHMENTHAPYYVDAADAPFKPWVHESAWSGMDRLHNAYLDAIHDQDKDVARAIRAFIAAQGGAPWLVLFTSDHGESFGEHHAIHHGQNLYDEQVHVPAWIAWGNGALDAGQIANLRAWSARTTTHLDLLPTLLDALGVLGSLDFAALRAGLPGRSLLGPVTPLAAPVPLTNCTSMFACPLDNWGVLGEEREIEAQPWDARWRCLDLAGGAEAADEATCAPLVERSRRWFPRLPDHHPNR